MIREASTPARTPQLKLARGADADVLISWRKKTQMKLQLLRPSLISFKAKLFLIFFKAHLVASLELCCQIKK